MAYRLGDYVLYGELRNESHYATYGHLVLRGEPGTPDTFVRLELTGNCDPDLRGKVIRFWADETYPDAAVFDRTEHQGLQLRQIGPTGTMTAQGWVRMMPCTLDEFLRRAKLGEPPPTKWVRRMYLEWFGQNGRVVVEVPNPRVEERIGLPGGTDDEGHWRELPNLGVLPDAEDPARATGLGITLVTLDEAGDANVQEFVVGSDSLADADYEDSASEEDIRELELIDRCIEEDCGRPIFELLPDLDRLPKPESVDDDVVEGLLKGLLGQLAILGIVLDVCEHFSPRDCYALLLNTILPDEETYDALIGTGWVQHFSTWEFCAACEERALRDYEEFSRDSE